MSLLEHHANKWIPEPMSGCFIWTGVVGGGHGNYGGIPRVYYRPKYGKRYVRSVPREVLLETVGPCPPGKEASHLCNNCYCVNPEHLRWETRRQNLNRKTKETRRRVGVSRGYCFHKRRGKYMAYYNIGHTRYHLGYFMTAEEARAAYLAAIKET